MAGLRGTGARNGNSTSDDATANSHLACRLINDHDSWPLLRADWDRLYAVTPDVTPWQSWDFLSRWWQTMRGSRLLRIIVIERDGVVQAIFPFQLSRLAPLQLRVLEPIGMPDDINRPRLALGVPDYTSFIAALRLLWQRRSEWDAIKLDEQLADAVEITWLRHFADAKAMRLEQLPFMPCPYLILGNWATWIASCNPRLLKNLRVARKRLEAIGPVSAERFDEPDGVLRAFDALVDVHERSWKHAAQVGLSQSDDYRRFYRDFVAARATRHQARAWVLSCNERPVAVTLALHEGSTYYSVHIAHDDAFSKCSPGTLLESIELEDLMKEKRFQIYDFLAGALRNKLRWTSTVQDTSRIWLLRRTLRSYLFSTYYFRIKLLIKELRSTVVAKNQKKPNR